MAAMTKTEHLEHFKGARELAARLSDQIEMCERQNRVIFTPFLSQGEGMIAQRLCGRGQPYAFDGGYPGAERCCYAFLPYPDTEVRFPICLLKAAYRPRFETLTHRDVLGAFMHQGIEREQLGDIVMTQDAVYVAVSDSISGYLIDQVTKIRHTSLRFERYEGVLHHTPSFEVRQYNVSSLRMDAVVAALCRLPRAKAASLIASGMVKVNDLPLETSSSLCHNNSTVSIRGHGRFQFIEVKHTTKKNRFVIEVRVYS